MCLLLSKVLPVFMYGITVTYPRAKTERLQLERLNLFVAHLCTNDYVSTYQQLLNKTGMRAVFQTVLHNRIHLAQMYSRGKRYLPPNTIAPPVRNNHLRPRFHDFGIRTLDATDVRYRHSALELASQAWNNLPRDLVQGNAPGVKSRLAKSDYTDASCNICRDMLTAILMM